MKPTAARQRRQAHKQRKQLARALHSAHMGRRAFRNAWRSGHASQVRIAKRLRPHGLNLLRTVFGGSW